MPEYQVTIIAEARCYIDVEAADEDEARAKAEQIGAEISDVRELSEFSVYEVTNINQGGF